MVIMLAALMMPMLVACGDDGESSGGYQDDDLISKAIGTWMCTQSTDIGNGQIYQGLMVGKEVTINAGGTYTSTSQSFGYTGTYTVSGNKITARSNNGSTFVVTVSINGDRMSWDGTASNGVTFNYVFVKEDDANQQTTIPVTREMISGTAWKVTNFTIERGSNSDIQNGKTIIFKADGSCEGFHSMETAWRINSGRIETYYEKTNEPMFVYTLLSISGDEVQIRMNGTLDDDLQAVIVLSKEPNTDSVTEEYLNKNTLVTALSGCYSYLAQFEDAQMNLEKLRVDKATVHSITPSSSQIRNTWQLAYKTINVANIIIEHAPTVQNIDSKDLDGILSEIRIIRAFVYYNLAMLWGDVPLVTNTASSDINSYTPTQNKQNEVYQFAYNEVSAVLGNIVNNEEKLVIGKDAGLVLKAELEMVFGKKNSALSVLADIDKAKYEAEIAAKNDVVVIPVIWAFKIPGLSNSYIPIYTYSHVSLYEKENSGNTNGLESEWSNFPFILYGNWAALKRMGKAQSVTGCYEHELLMPIPTDELALNPSMKQNPGY